MAKDLSELATVRNWNPGALDHNDTNNWVGGLGVEPGKRFERFQDEAYGFRAQTMTIFKYGKNYGLVSLNGITSRYAPTSENDTGAYTNTVAQASAITPGQRLDINATGMLEPKHVANITYHKTNYEADWSQPFNRIWDPVKHNIGLAMGTASRGREYLAEAEAKGDQAGIDAAKKLLAEAHGIDPFAAEAELKRGPNPTPEELTAEIASLTKNYEDGKVKPLNIQRGATASIAASSSALATQISEDPSKLADLIELQALQGKSPAERQAALSKFTGLKAVSAQGNINYFREKVGLNDKALIDKKILTPEELENYRKEQGIMPPVPQDLPEDRKAELIAQREEKVKSKEYLKVDENTYIDLKEAKAGEATQKLAEKVYAAREEQKTKNPSQYEQDNKRYGEDVATATKARKQREDDESTRDNAGKTAGSDIDPLLGLILMCFAYILGGPEAAQAVAQTLGMGGDGQGQGGGQAPRGPARSYDGFKPTRTNTRGNIPTLNPGEAKQPKPYNFYKAENNNPLLQLPVVSDNATTQRDGNKETLSAPFIDGKPARVVAPINGTVTKIDRDRHSITLSFVRKQKDQPDTPYEVTLSNVYLTAEQLKEGDKLNRGDQIGLMMGKDKPEIGVEVTRDGKPTADYEYAGLKDAATLSYTASKKDYDDREKSENNRLAISYGGKDKINEVENPDSRHHPFNGKSGVERNDNFPLEHYSDTQVQTYVQKFKEMGVPDAMKQDAENSKSGWTRGVVFTESDGTKGRGIYLYYNKNGEMFGRSVTSGGHGLTEGQENGLTPGAERNDYHPDPDINNVLSSSGWDKLGTSRTLSGDRLQPLSNAKNEAIRTTQMVGIKQNGKQMLRDGLFFHQGTSTHGCMGVVSEAQLASDTERTGTQGGNVFIVNPNYAINGPSKFKELPKDYAAQEAERGNAVVAGTNKNVIIAANANITNNPKEAYTAVVDNQGRLVEGNMPLAPSNPASTMKTGTLYVLADGIKKGIVPASIMNEEITYNSHSNGKVTGTVTELLPEIMGRSENDGTRKVAELFAHKATTNGKPMLDNSATDEPITSTTAIKAFNLHATDVFRGIGMNSTVMGDPAGHPDIEGYKGGGDINNTVSTARDMAVLAQRMDKEHPDFKKYHLASQNRTGASRLANEEVDTAKTGTGGDRKFSFQGAKSMIGATDGGAAFAVTHSTRTQWMPASEKMAEIANRNENAPPLTLAEAGVVLKDKVPEEVYEKFARIQQKAIPESAQQPGTQPAQPSQEPLRKTEAAPPPALQPTQDTPARTTAPQIREASFTYNSGPSTFLIDKDGNASGNNPDKEVYAASSTKLGVLYTIGELVKEGKLPTDFLDKNAGLTSSMLLATGETDYSAAPHALARAVEKQMGLPHNQGKFLALVKDKLEDAGLNHVDKIKVGGGWSTARDMATLIKTMEDDPYHHNLLDRFAKREDNRHPAGLALSGPLLAGVGIEHGKFGDYNGQQGLVFGGPNGVGAVLGVPKDSPEALIAPVTAAARQLNAAAATAANTDPKLKPVAYRDSGAQALLQPASMNDYENLATLQPALAIEESKKEEKLLREAKMLQLAEIAAEYQRKYGKNGNITLTSAEIEKTPGSGSPEKAKAAAKGAVSAKTVGPEHKDVSHTEDLPQVQHAVAADTANKKAATQLNA